MWLFFLNSMYDLCIISVDVERIIYWIVLYILEVVVYVNRRFFFFEDNVMCVLNFVVFFWYINIEI